MLTSREHCRRADAPHNLERRTTGQGWLVLPWPQGRLEMRPSSSRLGSSMYCQQCGKEIPSGATACPACGFTVAPAGSRPSAGAGSIDEAVSELKRAANEFGRAAASLSQRMAEKAGRAAKNPPESAKRVTRKVAQELDKVAKEIDRMLRDL